MNELESRDHHSNNPSKKLPNRYAVSTLSTANLLALEKSQHTSIKVLTNLNHENIEITNKKIIFHQYILNDLLNNLFIVALPAFFTNFVWRLEELYGIAQSHNFSTIMLEMILEIATAVFALCFIIDALRQIFVLSRIHCYNTLKESFHEYLHSAGFRGSFHLAFQFFMSVIFWRIGYELVSSEPSMYNKPNGIHQRIYRALGAGAGSCVGLVLAAELIAVSEYFFSNYYKISIQKTHNTHQQMNNGGFIWDTNQRGILGMGFKAICEGAAWAILADLEISSRLGETHSFMFKIVDALVVGFGSSFFFTMSGLFTSMMGYMIEINEVQAWPSHAQGYHRDNIMNSSDTDDQSGASGQTSEETLPLIHGQ